MGKLLVMLGAFFLIALAMLGLRHHRLELTAETARLQHHTRQQMHTLWDQQHAIAQRMNPLRLRKDLRAAGLETEETVASVKKK